jgi:2-iminobutanoate/2-iminopropanoate deaminase
MTHKIHDIGVAKHIGSYSDAIETEAGLRWYFTSGTPGLSDAGELPAGIEAQTRLAWKNVLDGLSKAGMTADDIVKVSTSLIDAGDIAAYARVRKEILGNVKPAFMLTVVSQLVKPEFLVEVEVIAARK